jgi:ATP-dependent helicase/nuclease subunit A
MNRDAATERQVQSADPRASSWIAANAGSGKTRVLTERVARLLLSGVQPQHILCLTYTKAAAAEMQNRLFRLLGEWAMKPDAELRAALLQLGEAGALPSADLARARRLFARALETPGGLRIQTIHSFCATLLRRFPLEAAVAPGFQELDDRAAQMMRAEIVEDMADRSDRALMAELAMAFSGEDFATLAQEVMTQRGAFAQPLDATGARAVFDVQDGDSEAALLADVFLGAEAELVAAILPGLLAGSTTDIGFAEKLAVLKLDLPGMAELSRLEDLFLYAAKTQAPHTAKIDRLPTKATRAALGPLLGPLQDWMGRVESARPRRLALAAARRTALLHRFAARFRPMYEQAKAARGRLDFDDLIQRAKALLTDRGVAAWVLFRLDGGIDHILVDEAQDTAPDQWRIIELLCAEFTAGVGARAGGRTLFVVGDKKQSIYSFQGADVAAFDHKQRDFGQAFRAAGLPFQGLELEHSFRSSPAVLRLVDETFGTRFPEALGDHMTHIAYQSDMPGRVDLWPLIEPTKAEQNDDWESPVDLVSETHHTAQLAQQIAEHIRQLIADGISIPVDPREDARGNRPVRAGDFLILVQRRSPLFSEIIRACKKLGLPIAGADRLKLGAELAVKDLTALLAFLATAEDDLSLAAVLRSPLCGWSEDELHRLAQPRRGFLWEALRNAEGQDATIALLQDLRDQADFLRPYELIDRVLTRHDGRRRLITRLGQEAEDGIDELLNKAISYESAEVPSLTGFLIWLETGEIEVKRQMDSAGDRIRVMTVHGAKGLEAPIVILPDTTDREPRERDEILRLGDGTAVWKTPAEDSPPAIAAARELRRKRLSEEGLRLLYVALTRARCWLIVAGAGEVKTERKTGAKAGPKDPLEWAWYAHVRAGMQAVGAVAAPGGGQRYETGTWPAPSAPSAVAAPTLADALPEWAVVQSDAVARPAPPLSPSDLGGAKALAGEGLEVDLAKARGTALHLLLEHLPRLPQVDWQGAATRLVPDGALLADVMPEAVRTLTAPDLAALFGPDTLAEVPLTAEVDGRRMLGTIDRLIIGADHVLAVDFKSNRVAPDSPDLVPEGILRQLGAYAAALEQIFPDRRIEVAILWTRAARLMPVPCNIVRAALQRSAIP